MESLQPKQEKRLMVRVKKLLRMKKVTVVTRSECSPGQSTSIAKSNADAHARKLRQNPRYSQHPKVLHGFHCDLAMVRHEDVVIVYHSRDFTFQELLGALHAATSAAGINGAFVKEMRRVR